jgi:hypothetical protein
MSNYPILPLLRGQRFRPISCFVGDLGSARGGVDGLVIETKLCVIRPKLRRIDGHVLGRYMRAVVVVHVNIHRVVALNRNEHLTKQVYTGEPRNVGVQIGRCIATGNPNSAWILSVEFMRFTGSFRYSGSISASMVNKPVCIELAAVS